MARSVQVLLPLLCVVLAEAQLPFFGFSGLHPPARPISDGPIDNWSTQGYHGDDFDSGWFQHFGNPDSHSFSSERHDRHKPDDNYDPFYHGVTTDDDNWNIIPGIRNIFNFPKPGHPAHIQEPHRSHPIEKPKQDHNDDSNEQKQEEKPVETPPVDKKPIEQDKGPKLSESDVPDAKNSSDSVPTKTNDNNKGTDNGDNDDKKVDLDKKKDFLLVGQGNNGNNLYLLHENNPPPNVNQPGNNIIYVPYNTGTTNTPVYQVINGQPTPLPTNMQMSPDKVGVTNGYNNAISNPGQLTVNTAPQNPGYVTIYSNGQLIQIPGVVVNPAPNNVQLQNGNQVPGTSYIIANAVPSNGQNQPNIQNPGTNVIYATLPNQQSNSPMYVQVPNCIQAPSNGCGSGTVTSNNGYPSNVIYQPNPNTVSQPAVVTNGGSNGYVQPLVGNQGQVLSNQNGQYQPTVGVPVSSGFNGYNQPIVSNLGQGQNVPNQGGMINNQNVPIQTAVQMPVNSGSNGYNQVTSQRQSLNTPNQGDIVNNQYTAPQPAVEMPIGNGISGYNQPMVSNQVLTNNPNPGIMSNNQNMPSQPAINIPITNGYNEHPPVTNPSPTVNVESRGEMPNNQNAPQLSALVTGGLNDVSITQPQVPIQGDQVANTIVNTPSNAAVITQESDPSQPLVTSSLVLDSSNLSTLGAQPAIMISSFKDKPIVTKNKKDSKEVKDKKKKKDKGKKKDKNVNVANTLTPTVAKPFTNME